MKIIKPSVELLWITPNAEQMIERSGRICYQSCEKITDDSAAKFVDKINKLGHHSVLEHGVASIKFITDRGVTHELVRHRMASYSQESTRYCSYNKDKFGGELSFIEPPFKTEAERAEWVDTCEIIEWSYLYLLNKCKTKPEIARAILPNCLKTEIVMTANFREWLHVIALRSSRNKGAHPQIKEIIDMAEEILAKECPSIFKCERLVE